MSASQSDGSSDTIVRCDWCGRQERARLVMSLRSGWPTCCKGHTMRLIRTDADIEAATRHVIEQQMGGGS